LVRMRGIRVLTTLDDVAGVRKTRADRAGRIARRVSTRVIEVQVRIYDHHDLVGADADLPESILEARRSSGTGVLDTVDVVEFRGLLIPGARVDQHRTDVVLDQQTPHAELNAIPFVR